MTRLILRPLVAFAFWGLLCLEAFPVIAAPPEADDEGQESAAAGRSSERVGWLRPNYNSPGVDAPFTLIDNAGRIRAFVRPAPGVRIGRYVNHRIRVRGSETALPDRQVGLMAVTEAGGPDAVLGQDPPPERRTAGPRAFAGSERYAAVRQAAFEEVAPPMVDDTIGDIGPEMNGSGMNGPETTDSNLVGPNTSAPRSRLIAPAEQSSNDFSPGPLMESEGEPPYDGDQQYHADGCGPSCSQCGGCGHATCNSCCHNICGPPGRIWVRAEYLYWFTEGMHIPPLVTSGPSANQPGYLGSPGTQVLFGGNQVNGFGRSGGRITLGAWLNPCQTFGIEGDYFGLQTAATNFSATSYGSPILSRPFYDVGIRNPATNPTVVGQNVELVAESGVINGTVSAYTSTALQGAGARLRFNLCCSQGCGCNACCPSLNGPRGCRVDFLLGYRFLQLRDAVSVQENLTTLNTAPATSFQVNDSFNTKNQFNGVDLGVSLMKYHGRWSFELIPRVALGTNYEVCDIAGSTSIGQGGVTTNYTGGLLAQSSNIGHYTRNNLAAVPELGANLGYWVTPRLRAIVGYTFLYWSGVARAGDQIDTNVNSTTLPASGATTAGDPRYPMFAWHTTDFWAQGINAGLDYRW